MENMYSKLQDKYTKLKAQKDAETDSINLDQEIKFMEYKSAADELIEHTRHEHDRLRSQIIVLLSELASIRSSTTDQHGESKENRKENNERVEDLRNDELHNTAEKITTAGKKSVMSGDGGAESDTINIVNSSSKRKQLRGSTPVEPGASHILRSNSSRKRSRQHGTSEIVHAPESDSTSEVRQIALLGVASHIDQPACCRRTQDVSGNNLIAGSAPNCIFQDLSEHLLGMKLSATTKADGICISALHQSSGYLFNLTLVGKKEGEMEWVYDPVSLGTFEMGAPEWMKEASNVIEGSRAGTLSKRRGNERNGFMASNFSKMA